MPCNGGSVCERVVLLASISRRGRSVVDRDVDVSDFPVNGRDKVDSGDRRDGGKQLRGFPGGEGEGGPSGQMLEKQHGRWTWCQDVVSCETYAGPMPLTMFLLKVEEN